MKILIIQDYLRSGGTERHSLFLAAEFAKALSGPQLPLGRAVRR